MSIRSEKGPCERGYKDGNGILSRIDYSVLAVSRNHIRVQAIRFLQR